MPSILHLAAALALVVVAAVALHYMMPASASRRPLLAITAIAVAILLLSYLLGGKVQPEAFS